MTSTRTALFVDGWNIARQSRDCLNADVDYARFLEYLNDRNNIVRAYFYIGTPSELDKMDRMTGFLQMLHSIGFTVVTKPIREYESDNGELYRKADFDVNISVDMMAIANKIDKVILCSGDGDFVRLFEFVKNIGVETEVISCLTDGTGKQVRATSRELIETADIVVDMAEIIGKICK